MKNSVLALILTLLLLPSAIIDQDPPPMRSDLKIKGIVLFFSGQSLTLLVAPLVIQTFCIVENIGEFEITINSCKRMGILATFDLELSRYHDGSNITKIRRIDLETDCHSEFPKVIMIFAGSSKKFNHS